MIPANIRARYTSSVPTFYKPSFVGDHMPHYHEDALRYIERLRADIGVLLEVVRNREERNGGLRSLLLVIRGRHAVEKAALKREIARLEQRLQEYAVEVAAIKEGSGVMERKFENGHRVMGAISGDVGTYIGDYDGKAVWHADIDAPKEFRRIPYDNLRPAPRTIESIVRESVGDFVEWYSSDRPVAIGIMGDAWGEPDAADNALAAIITAACDEAVEAYKARA